MKITIKNIENLFSLINDKQEIDLSTLEWIEPVGIATLSLAIKQYNLNIIDPSNQNIKNYLEVMRVNNHSKQSYQGNTYVPLINLNRGQSDILARDLSNNITNNTNFNKDEELKQDINEYLRYMILEIINNVIDHSNSSQTPVANAQYYNNKDVCQIAIVDTGIGFLSSLKNNYPHLFSEESALNEAIKKEVTGATRCLYGSTVKNVGYGLYYISEIIKLTHGYMKIISNNGMLIIENGEVSIFKLKNPWKGTIVAFQLKTRSYEITYDLQSLLKIIQVPEENEEIEEIF